MKNLETTKQIEELKNRVEEAQTVEEAFYFYEKIEAIRKDQETK